MSISKTSSPPDCHGSNIMNRKLRITVCLRTFGRKAYRFSVQVPTQIRCHINLDPASWRRMLSPAPCRNGF